MFRTFLFCMHLVRVIRQGRSPLNLKRQHFIQQCISSSFVAQIGNLLWIYDVKKTHERDVEGCIRIGSVEVE